MSDISIESLRFFASGGEIVNIILNGRLMLVQCPEDLRSKKYNVTISPTWSVLLSDKTLVVTWTRQSDSYCASVTIDLTANPTRASVLTEPSVQFVVPDTEAVVGQYPDAEP